jgi:hypothetical protein
MAPFVDERGRTNYRWAMRERRCDYSLEGWSVNDNVLEMLAFSVAQKL